jgi:hypothetical protein
LITKVAANDKVKLSECCFVYLTDSRNEFTKLLITNLNKSLKGIEDKLKQIIQDKEVLQKEVDNLFLR